MNKNKHLSLDDRYQIMHSLEDRLSFKAISKLVGKDCTTISKEIKGHIIFQKKGAPYRPFNDCVHRTRCHINYDLCNDCKTNRHCSTCGKCTSLCAQYEKEACDLHHQRNDDMEQIIQNLLTDSSS